MTILIVIVVGPGGVRVVVMTVLLAGMLIGVTGARSVDQLLQLATVEEDPAALGALIELHVASLVRAHIATALGTNEGRCGTHL